MDNVQKELLKQIAGLHEIPVGAYNIRTNGKTEGLPKRLVKQWKMTFM